MSMTGKEIAAALRELAVRHPAARVYPLASGRWAARVPAAWGGDAWIRADDPATLGELLEATLGDPSTPST